MTAKGLTRDFGKLLAGDLGAQTIGVLRGFAVPLLVTPAQYGLWRIVLLVWQYGIYLHLGSFALLNRELPGLLATREHDRFAEMRQTAFWGTMATSSLAASGLVILSLTPSANSVPGESWALRLAALGIVGQQLSVYLLVDFRVRSSFGSMSLLNITQAIAALCFMLPLAYVGGVPGLAGGVTLAAFVTAAAFGRRSAFEPPRFRARAFLRQVRDGIPLSSLPLLNTTITSTGQVSAAALIGLEGSAFFGLGVMLGTVVYAVPRGIGMVLYPRYLASYATAADPSQLGGPLRRSLEITSVFSAVAVCVAAILIGPVLRLALPKYLPALGAIYVLIAMMPFVSYALVLQNALLALRRHAHVIAIQVTAVATGAGLSSLGAVATGDVRWVAGGVMAAHVLSGVATMWLGLSATRVDHRQPLRDLLAELLPVTLLGGVTVAMLVFWKPTDLLESQLAVAALQLLILCPFAVFFGVRTWRAVRGAAE